MSLHVHDLTLDVTDGQATRRILNNVSLDLNPGEVVGVAGPSGSGKSTLLSVLGGLQQATSGTARLTTSAGNSIDLIDGHGAAVRRQHVGIVFQQPNLLASLSVIDQLLLMPRLGRVWPSLPAGSRAKATELLDAVGLPDFAHRRVTELSGGQQARVNLARSLMNAPELLLVDEPTAALDSATAADVTELIRRMASQYGAATLYVSHDPEQLRALDRTIELVDGAVVAPV